MTCTQKAEPKPLHITGERHCVLSALLGFVQELVKREDPSLILTQYPPESVSVLSNIAHRLC